MVLSIFYTYAFGLVKIKPSTAPGYDASQEPKNTEHVSFAKFYCDCWALTDVLGTHRLTTDATTPLAGKAQV